MREIKFRMRDGYYKCMHRDVPGMLWCDFGAGELIEAHQRSNVKTVMQYTGLSVTFTKTPN